MSANGHEQDEKDSKKPPPSDRGVIDYRMPSCVKGCSWINVILFASSCLNIRPMVVTCGEVVKIVDCGSIELQYNRVCW
jgi:hypothetical protein